MTTTTRTTYTRTCRGDATGAGGVTTGVPPESGVLRTAGRVFGVAGDIGAKAGGTFCRHRWAALAYASLATRQATQLLGLYNTRPPANQQDELAPRGPLAA